MNDRAVVKVVLAALALVAFLAGYMAHESAGRQGTPTIAAAP